MDLPEWKKALSIACLPKSWKNAANLWIGDEDISLSKIHCHIKTLWFLVSSSNTWFDYKPKFSEPLFFWACNCEKYKKWISSSKQNSNKVVLPYNQKRLFELCQTNKICQNYSHYARTKICSKTCYDTLKEHSSELAANSRLLFFF